LNRVWKSDFSTEERQLISDFWRSMKLKILIAVGDGTGPKVTNEAVRVLKGPAHWLCIRH
jgi:hypothetical protein